MNILKSRKAQLGFIEMKFFFMGLIIGLVIGIVIVYLSAKGIIPLGFVKGMFCGKV